MNRAMLLVVMGVVSGASCARTSEMPPAVRSLVDAERAFATMSVTVGMRDAFLANFADDGIVFRPGPVNAKEVYRARPASAVVLSWEPVHAEVSSSGNFGFTTGPWEFRPDRDSEPVAFGHFVSVWKREADGSWKVAADAGIDHERPASTPELSFRAPAGSNTAGDATATALAHSKLLESDRAFADGIRVSAGRAYAEFAAPDVRLYRTGRLPLAGREPVCDAVGEEGLPGTMEPAGARVADSGDLGYTTGFTRSSASSYYLRIWRAGTDGVWKIVLDLEVPVPPGE